MMNRLQINRLFKTVLNCVSIGIKTLPANLYAFVDDKRFDLFYLGEAPKTAVWHCFRFNEATAKSDSHRRWRNACYGAEAFTSPVKPPSAG